MYVRARAYVCVCVCMCMCPMHCMRTWRITIMLLPYNRPKLFPNNIILIRVKYTLYSQRKHNTFPLLFLNCLHRTYSLTYLLVIGRHNVIWYSYLKHSQLRNYGKHACQYHICKGNTDIIIILKCIDKWCIQVIVIL